MNDLLELRKAITSHRASLVLGQTPALTSAAVDAVASITADKLRSANIPALFAHLDNTGVGHTWGGGAVVNGGLEPPPTQAPRERGTSAAPVRANIRRTPAALHGPVPVGAHRRRGTPPDV
jgi:hypothetical protein